MSSIGMPKTPYEFETRRQLSAALSVIDKALENNPRETVVHLGDWNNIEVYRIYDELVEILAREYPSVKEAVIEHERPFTRSYYSEPSGKLRESIAVRFFTPKEMAGLMPTSIFTAMTCPVCGTKWDTYVFNIHSSCPKCGASNYNDELYRGRNSDEAIQLIERAFFYELDKKWSGLYDETSIRIGVNYGGIALESDERAKLERELRTRLSKDNRFTSFSVSATVDRLYANINLNTKTALRQKRANTPINLADGSYFGCLVVLIILIALGVLVILFR